MSYIGLNQPQAVVDPNSLPQSGGLIQRLESVPVNTYQTNIVAIPLDDTIPQDTEGGVYGSVVITPTSVDSLIVLKADVGQVSHSVEGGFVMGALFQSGSTDAIASNIDRCDAVGGPISLSLEGSFIAGTTNPITVSFRMGPNSGTLYINGNTSGRLLGGASAIRFSVEEIAQ